MPRERAFLDKLLSCDVTYVGAKTHVEARVREEREESLAELKKRVKSILILHANGIRVKKLQREFKNVVGYPIPFMELGFSSDIELLKSFTDICKVEEPDDDDDDDDEENPVIIPSRATKTSLIYKSVDAYCAPQSLGRQEKPRSHVLIPFAIQDAIRKLLYHHKELDEDEFYEICKDRYALEFLHLQIGTKKIVEALPHMLKLVDHKVMLLHPVTRREVEDVQQRDDQYALVSYRKSELERQIGRNVHKVVDFKGAICVDELPGKYMVNYKKELDHFRLGFNTLTEFLLLVPGEFEMRRVNHTTYLTSVNYFDDDFKEKDMKKFDINALCGEEGQRTVIRNILFLLRHVNEGVRRQDLAIVYEIWFSQKMLYQDEFIERLIRDNLVKIDHENGCDVLKFVQTCYNPRYMPINFEQFETPASAVDNDFRFPPPKANLLGRTLSVNVSYYVSPGKFYIQIDPVDVMKKCVEHINPQSYRNFQEKLQSFYFVHFGEYMIKQPNQVMPTTPIVACINGEWCRAYIDEIINPTSVLVFDIDTGRKQLVPMGALCFLNKKFLGTPPYAFQAKLLFVKPRHSSSPQSKEWSVLVDTYFLDQTSGTCVAIVSGIGRKGELHIDLYNDRGRTAVDINHNLVIYGWADCLCPRCISLDEPNCHDQPPPL